MQKSAGTLRHAKAAAGTVVHAVQAYDHNIVFRQLLHQFLAFSRRDLYPPAVQACSHKTTGVPEKNWKRRRQYSGLPASGYRVAERGSALPVAHQSEGIGYKFSLQLQGLA